MRILLIEDDLNLSESLAFQLEKEGFLTDRCSDGLDAFYYIDQNVHDLILLDRMLPGMNGIDILNKMRKQGISTPVIMLTALGSLDDKITGLDTGADDYLVKPFAFEELMARIRCLNRRPRQWENADTISFCDITYHASENMLTGSNGSCTLSRIEGALLEFLITNHTQTLRRMTILMKVWGPDTEIEEGNLDNYIHFARRRLKAVSNKVCIRTVRGVGYALEEKHV